MVLQHNVQRGNEDPNSADVHKIPGTVVRYSVQAFK